MLDLIRFGDCNVINDTVIVTLASAQDWLGHFFDKPPARLFISTQKVEFDYFGWDGQAWLYFCKENPAVSLEVVLDIKTWSSIHGWVLIELDSNGHRVSGE